MSNKIPDSWEDYLKNNPYGFDSPYLEVVRSVIWDTERYRGGGFVTDPPQGYGISFFQNLKKRRRESNMVCPGYLYNPCSFLVEEIKIKGPTRILAKNGIVMFTIGNKIFLEAPLDMFVRHQKYFVLNPMLMIAPLVHFNFRIDWPKERYNGGDQPKIEVTLRGQMARPIQ
jgi:hypothetical protein